MCKLSAESHTKRGKIVLFMIVGCVTKFNLNICKVLTEDFTVVHEHVENDVPMECDGVGFGSGCNLA